MPVTDIDTSTEFYRDLLKLLNRYSIDGGDKRPILVMDAILVMSDLIGHCSVRDKKLKVADLMNEVVNAIMKGMAAANELRDEKSITKQ